eukprot:7405194-Ditylum_brightwellii.AAC.1
MCIRDSLDTWVPDVTNPQCSAFEHYDESPEDVPFDITREDVAAVLVRLHDRGGTGSTDTVEIKN